MTPTDQISIRRAEPADFEAVTRIHACPRVIWGTFALPFPSAEMWRKRLAEPTEGFYHLLACAGSEIVGHLGLHTYPNQPRRRHVGYIGMAVRDDW
jgi:putative acetyltransferase